MCACCTCVLPFLRLLWQEISIHNAWNKDVVRAFFPDYLVPRDAVRIFRRAPNPESLQELAEPAEREFKNLYRKKKEKELQPRHYNALDLFHEHFVPDQGFRHTLKTKFHHLSAQLDSHCERLSGKNQERPKKSKRTRSPETSSERLPPSHPARLQPPSGPTVEDLLAEDRAETPEEPHQGDTPEAPPSASTPDWGPVQTAITAKFPDCNEAQQDRAYTCLSETVHQLAREFPEQAEPIVHVSYSHARRVKRN